MTPQCMNLCRQNIDDVIFNTIVFWAALQLVVIIGIVGGCDFTTVCVIVTFRTNVTKSISIM